MALPHRADCKHFHGLNCNCLLLIKACTRLNPPLGAVIRCLCSTCRSVHVWRRRPVPLRAAGTGANGKMSGELHDPTHAPAGSDRGLWPVSRVTDGERGRARGGGRLGGGRAPDEGGVAEERADGVQSRAGQAAEAAQPVREAAEEHRQLQRGPPEAGQAPCSWMEELLSQSPQNRDKNVLCIHFQALFSSSWAFTALLPYKFFFTPPTPLLLDLRPPFLPQHLLLISTPLTYKLPPESRSSHFPSSIC